MARSHGVRLTKQPHRGSSKKKTDMSQGNLHFTTAANHLNIYNFLGSMMQEIMYYCVSAIQKQCCVVENGLVLRF